MILHSSSFLLVLTFSIEVFIESETLSALLSMSALK